VTPGFKTFTEIILNCIQLNLFNLNTKGTGVNVFRCLYNRLKVLFFFGPSELSVMMMLMMMMMMMMTTMTMMMIRESVWRGLQFKAKLTPLLVIKKSTKLR